jgi:hypothetical protein
VPWFPKSDDEIFVTLGFDASHAAEIAATAQMKAGLTPNRGGVIRIFGVIPMKSRACQTFSAGRLNSRRR